MPHHRDRRHAYEQYGNVSHTAISVARGHRNLAGDTTLHLDHWDHNHSQPAAREGSELSGLARVEGGYDGRPTTDGWSARGNEGIGGGGGRGRSRYRGSVTQRAYRTACSALRIARWALKNSLRNLLSMDRQKSTSLGALVLQTSVLALTIRYSRTETVPGPRYLTSTAVVTSELVKLLVCLYMVFYHPASSAREAAWEDVLNVKEAAKTAVPAGLYTLQNNLQFIAVSHLDAATFQLTYQLKILTTAVFSVLFLQRQLGSLRWSALVTLTVGVIMVQMSAVSEEELSGRGSRETTVVGLMAVLAMCVSSGFAGVYFEKILKSSTQSVWAKNVQMAAVSVVLGLLAVVMGDWKQVRDHGFFQGYNTLTLVIVLQQAILGLIISMVMKYADNILKGFASAISIILTSLISSVFLHDLHPTCSFLFGSIIVLFSALLYNVDQQAFQQKSQTVI